MLRQFIWIGLAVLFSFSETNAAQFKVFKENDQQRALITNEKNTIIFYQNVGWGQLATKIEKGFLFLRDRSSGEVYELELIETEPNSTVFSANIPAGAFHSKNLEAEIFSVPAAIYEGKNRLAVVKELIATNALKRKPFLLRLLRQKGQVIDVFDNKEDALAAFDKFKKLSGLDPSDKNIQQQSDSIIEVGKGQQPESKKIIDTSTLESMFLANSTGLKSELRKNEEIREVLREVETKRRRAVKNNGKSWTASVRAANETKSKELTKQAFADMGQKLFPAAREKLLKASDLGPRSELLYQEYGIALFHDQKYNQSIVVLELAQADRSQLAARYYYLGMNYYQLQDYETAEKYFQQSKDLKDQKISLTSAFYLGTVQLKVEKFDESKQSFQYVLDNSNNPAMDTRAEQYIEYGIQQKALAEKRKHRWFFDGVLGTFYDSNIVLAIDGQQNVNTDKDGIRFMSSNRIKYRAINRERNELAIRASATILQSQKTDLSSSEDLAITDPWVAALEVPWTYRGTLWRRGYTFDLSPKYETILMDLDNTERQAIINSTALTMNNKLVINPNWVAVANYEIRQDDAQSSTGTITDAADAFKLVADFSSIIVLNKQAERYLIPQLAYTRNDAKGADFGFTRLDLAATFTNGLWDKFVWSNKLGIYVANYESLRADKNYNVTSGLAYTINAHWNFGLNLNYQINDSNTNRYKKFQVISTFSFSF